MRQADRVCPAGGFSNATDDDGDYHYQQDQGWGKRIARLRNADFILFKQTKWYSQKRWRYFYINDIYHDHNHPQFFGIDIVVFVAKKTKCSPVLFLNWRSIIWSGVHFYINQPAWNNPPIQMQSLLPPIKLLAVRWGDLESDKLTMRRMEREKKLYESIQTKHLPGEMHIFTLVTFVRLSSRIVCLHWYCQKWNNSWWSLWRTSWVGLSCPNFYNTIHYYAEWKLAPLPPNSLQCICPWNLFLPTILQSASMHWLFNSVWAFIASCLDKCSY